MVQKHKHFDIAVEGLHDTNPHDIDRHCGSVLNLFAVGNGMSLAFSTPGDLSWLVALENNLVSKMTR